MLPNPALQMLFSRVILGLRSVPGYSAIQLSHQLTKLPSCEPVLHFFDCILAVNSLLLPVQGCSHILLETRPGVAMGWLHSEPHTL